MNRRPLNINGIIGRPQPASIAHQPRTDGPDINTKQAISSRLGHIEEDLGRCALVVKALVRLCIEKGVLDEPALLKKLEEIDLEDGKRDGKAARDRAPRACHNCGKTNAYSSMSCMYCGVPFALDQTF